MFNADASTTSCFASRKSFLSHFLQAPPTKHYAGAHPAHVFPGVGDFNATTLVRRGLNLEFLEAWGLTMKKGGGFRTPGMMLAGAQDIPGLAGF